MKSINIYCDESGHLERDQVPVMVLGALWCDADKAREIAVRIREIKQEHGLPRYHEVKWTKVSPRQRAFYLALLNYFFDDDDLHFRAVVVPDKGKLDHGRFRQDHDTWYYKMYFQLLSALINPSANNQVYLDLKDTLGKSKVDKLHEVLSNNLYDFDRRIIRRIQTVRSNEIEQIQLADLLIGAVSYANRNLVTSSTKVALVERMRERSKHTLTSTTLIQERKVNVFVWGAS
jgi:hypothetical protein